jgi:hypothetical protein
VQREGWFHTRGVVPASFGKRLPVAALQKAGLVNVDTNSCWKVSIDDNRAKIFIQRKVVHGDTVAPPGSVVPMTGLAAFFLAKRPIS